MDFKQVIKNLQKNPNKWLITGVAGFIGSNLLEFLLKHNQYVVGLDNFSTGYLHNLDEVQKNVSAEAWRNFSFFQEDIRDLSTCQAVCEGVNYVLHHAALGSVPYSIHDPINVNSVNIDGFLNMLVAARDSKVESFTYASSSSIYGDDETLPKIENKTGAPLSPYAITKCVNELYATVFANRYGLNTIGLRYFNVFGKRQNKLGAYAAVIPAWISAMLKNEVVYIYGDGETSRDFCFIDNVVQANILAATADERAKNQIYNIALNEQTTLNQLFDYLKNTLYHQGIEYNLPIIYQPFRAGDVKHSRADIYKAMSCLGYEPTHRIKDGMEEAVRWYIEYEKNQ
ncbi:MAG: SDR family oxidoreductase [Legionellaceae bacterium]|nr:SDR family oxidoreductase [Legionellaceae bacterium]